MSDDKRVYLFDSTLRDGAQTQGVDFSVADKVAIAQALDRLGVDYVEGGWPGANPTDDAFFGEPPTLDTARLVAFGMTRRAGRSAENDPGLSAVLLSNPCNPTGRVILGDELHDWVDAARALECVVIFDEFYSHYLYESADLTASAARYVEDVDRDPVVIVDGLTKNWRYPGLRVSWTVGPPAIIELIASAGSFLDGGCARPMQVAAQPLLDPDLADREARAIQAAAS